MSLLSTPELEQFWNLFIQKMQNTPVQDSDWVTNYTATKNSKLKRGSITRLAQDGLIRTKGDLYCLTDVLTFSQFVSYFDAAKENNLVKEIDLQGTGNIKYQIVDGRNSRIGKGLAQYQSELILGIAKQFLEPFYDIKPKKNVEIPENLKI